MAGPYRFGDFTLDPQARELRRSGELLTVSPKVFDCIVYLIERRERAVGRDELIAAVWGRVDVADIQLGQLVRKLRHTLDDDGNAQATVRTVPRFGFRWIAPVQQMEAPATSQSTAGPAVPDQAHDSVTPPPAPDIRRHSLWFVAVGLLFAGLVASGAGYRWYRHRATPTPDTQRIGSQSPPGTVRSVTDVVVLPVSVPARDSDEAWMRLGLMDLISSRLHDTGLAVVPSDNVVALASKGGGANSSAEQVRQATGARTVVSPTVIRTNRGWTLRMELQAADETPHEIEAQGADAMSAARIASDRLADVLGAHPPINSTDSSELEQRIEAALLTKDFATAQRLIASAPASARNTPALRFAGARIAIGLRHFQEASDTLTQLLAETPAETLPVLRARVLDRLATATFRLGHPDRAEQQFGEAIALLENRNEPVLLGAVYVDRGSVTLLRARYDDAAADFSRARVVLEPTGDTLALAGADLAQGNVESMRNHYADALSLYERAEQVFERYTARHELARVMGNEINAYLHLLHSASALAVYARARAELTETDVALEPELQFQFARALEANGRLTEARKWLLRIRQTGDPIRDANLLAMTNGFEIMLDFDDGDPRAAAGKAPRVVESLLNPEYAQARASTWLWYLRALRLLHRDADVAHEVRRFVAWADTTANADVIVRARLAEAEAAWTGRHKEVAILLHEDALRVANQGSVPGNVVGVAVSYGNALLDEGDLLRAGAVVGQIEHWADGDFDCALLETRLYHALGQREAWQVALHRARALAGERPIPADLSAPPRNTLELGAER
jgi:DNA-binding winged helix-turn-helix (wHTH) protein/tetratricopeptide (TPR) repeat protein